MGINMRWLISGTLLLLGFFAILSFNKNGEVLSVMSGEVQRCETLGGSQTESMSHATIKTDNGSYIIARLGSCSPGVKVSVLIRRGALYFNTVYAAEKL